MEEEMVFSGSLRLEKILKWLEEERVTGTLVIEQIRTSGDGRIIYTYSRKGGVKTPSP
ncbi:MAG: hypothetical protein AAB545_01385 [Patescibacteria group bacterium]